MNNIITIQSEADFIKIQLNRFAYPDAIDSYDKNWIDVTINLKAGAFTGRYCAYFQTTDLLFLYDELRKLHKDLNSGFTFTTLEQQLELSFKGDGIGHIEISGVANDDAGNGNGNALNFELHIDQTILPLVIQEIKEGMNDFPFK